MKTCLAVFLLLSTIPLFGQQAFRKGGLYGLVAADGSILIEPVCDTIYRPVSNFPLFIYHSSKQYHCFVRIGGEQAKWQTFGSYDAVDAGYRDVFRQGMEVTADGKAGCLFVHFETSGRLSHYETLYEITGIDSSGIRYDAVEWNRLSAPHGFATLVLDGKYGLFSEHGELLEPVYEERPEFCENDYFIVRRDGLQGVVYADSLTGFHTMVTPSYRELRFIGGELFRTHAPGEELKVIHARTGSALTIKDARNKIVHNPDDGISGYYLSCDLENDYYGSCAQIGEGSLLYITHDFSTLPPDLPPLQRGIRELYVYELKGAASFHSAKKVLSFEDPEAVYGTPAQGWLSEVRWANERHKKVIYTFYDLPGGEKLFSLKVKAEWELYVDPETKGEKRWNRIEMHHRDHHGERVGSMQQVQKGFYNLDTRKYHRFLKI